MTTFATCPVCGTRASAGLEEDESPDGVATAPQGWDWACGEVGWVCGDPSCSRLAKKFGLTRGNHRPDDDYLVVGRGDPNANLPHWGRSE